MARGLRETTHNNTDESQKLVGVYVMSTWSLSELLAGLHDDIESRLSTARKSFGHPGTKGDASEHVWLELLQTYLPRRYHAETAHVVDSNGAFSEQIDVVVFDRQYSPFIFHYEGQVIMWVRREKRRKMSISR